MFSRSPLFWLRWGAIVLVVAICAGDLAEHAPTYLWWQVVLVGLVYAIFAVLFYRNTASFPRHWPWQQWILVGQILLSTPLESNLSVVTVATIPLVLARRRWKRWIVITLALVATQLLAHNSYRLYTNRTLLPAEATPVVILFPLLSGVLELLAWHAFAFLAAVMIVRFDDDRRRLAVLNAEMRGAQVLLMDSSRIAERLRISRELHDSLGHHLTSLSLQLEVAEHLPDQQIRPKLAEARFLARLVLAEIREAVSEWRSETSAALPEALRTLADGMPGLTVQLDLQPQLPTTAPSVAHALFRCAQEALTNAIRHGAATHVQLRLNHQQESLFLRIADDGAGCAAVAPGNGLRGMVSRIEEIGGTISFQSSPGHGFQIEIRVQIPESTLQ